jgi:hypothetical protein
MKQAKECEEILELNYKRYKFVNDVYGAITDLMRDIAWANIIIMQKKFPEKLEESKKQIKELERVINNGEELPPIIIEVNKEDEFVTVTDGMHRILAYRNVGIVRCFMKLVERVENERHEEENKNE